MTSAAPSEVLVRLSTHPHSVRTARRLVADTLRSWGLEQVADDAGLVVSELTTNATLHSGSSSFQLSVRPPSSAGVRIAVGDDGAVPAAAVVRRPGRDGGTAVRQRPETTTGRGLAIVDELASAWGVTSDGTTKWVWAELPAGETAEAAVRPTTGQLAPSALPPGWRVVQLVDCPVVLSLVQDDHLDELVRELQLLGAQVDEPELAPVIRGLLDGQAQARHTGRRTAQDAADQGREVVTVEMLLPSAAAEQVERLDAAVAAADALCERQRLLTLASPVEVRELRAWMRDEIAEQLRHAAAPRSFARWRASAGGA